MPDSPPAFGSGSRRDGRTLPGPRSGTAVPPPAALVTPRSPIPLPLPPSAAADYPGQEARAGGSAATAGSRWRAARALPDSAPCAVPPARPGRHRPHLSSGDRTEPPRTPRPQHLRTCPAALSPPPGAEATPAPAATPRLRLAARPAPRPGRAPPPPRPPAPPAARHGTASLRPRRDSPDGAGLPAPRGLPGWSRAASADRQRDGVGADSEGVTGPRAPQLGASGGDRSNRHVPPARPVAALCGTRMWRPPPPAAVPSHLPTLCGSPTSRPTHDSGRERPAAAARSRAEQLLLESV